MYMYASYQTLGNQILLFSVLLQNMAWIDSWLKKKHKLLYDPVVKSEGNGGWMIYLINTK